MRRLCKEVNAGGVLIGGNAPISIQSMTTTNTKNISKTLEQIQFLHAAGADIMRLAVTDMDAAKAFGEIRKKSPLPLVADIHFDYKIALACISYGADKIRINPGNIGGKDRVRAVANEALSAKVPIRIGVNLGSIEPALLNKYGPTPRAMVESAKNHIKLLEDEGFSDIVVSLKASSVPKTVKAYEIIARECNYPLHLGVTEAGTPYQGIIKSASGIGSLLLSGIGDTLRVSLTAPPIEEIRAAKALLSALEIQKSSEIVSCPTCGRCKIDLFPIAKKVEDYLMTLNKPLKVAVMGCAVNGPGEAKEADIGIAAGDKSAIIFKKGKLFKKVSEEDILKELFTEIDNMVGE